MDTLDIILQFENKHRLVQRIQGNASNNDINISAFNKKSYQFNSSLN